jgi:hypothetical protein
MNPQNNITKYEIWFGIVFIIFGLVICCKYLPKQDGRVYNCSTAEINPDFPLAARIQCRKQMIGR